MLAPEFSGVATPAESGISTPRSDAAPGFHLCMHIGHAQHASRTQASNKRFALCSFHSRFFLPANTFRVSARARTRTPPRRRPKR